MKYKVVSTWDKQDFQFYIDNYLSKGWELYGELKIAHSSSDGGLIYFNQALIKKEDKDT